MWIKRAGSCKKAEKGVVKPLASDSARVVCKRGVAWSVTRRGGLIGRGQLVSVRGLAAHDRAARNSHKRARLDRVDWRVSGHGLRARSSAERSFHTTRATPPQCSSRTAVGQRPELPISQTQEAGRHVVTGNSQRSVTQPTPLRRRRRRSIMSRSARMAARGELLISPAAGRKITTASCGYS